MAGTYFFVRKAREAICKLACKMASEQTVIETKSR